MLVENEGPNWPDDQRWGQLKDPLGNAEFLAMDGGKVVKFWLPAEDGDRMVGKQVSWIRGGVLTLGLGASMLVVVHAGSGGDPPSDLSWHTIDGGGVIRSMGGSFELSGTIGQPDAGRSGGGNFTLTGGFWFEVVSSDCNQDGVVNLIDYDTFEQCLTGPGGGPLPTGCNCDDLDADGVITLRDFAIVQRMFNG
ncbi:MAG: dockerin type I domain-containing protein [Planctomycetota bacterium]